MNDASIANAAVAQDSYRIRLVVQIAHNVDRAVEIAAAERNVTKRQIVEDAIRKYLKIKAA